MQASSSPSQPFLKPCGIDVANHDSEHEHGGYDVELSRATAWAWAKFRAYMLLDMALVA